MSHGRARGCDGGGGRRWDVLRVERSWPVWSHLIDVHAVVAGQRASRRQVVGAEERGDDAVLVHLPDRGAVDEIYQSVLAHGDACAHRGEGGVITKTHESLSACMTQWTEHDGYMCQACLPIIQVTAKSTAINNSQAAFLLLNYFAGRSGKGCIHKVYMHLPLLETPLSKKEDPGTGGVNEWCVFGDLFFRHGQSSTICTPFEK